MEALDDLSDDEFRLLATAPTDNLKKQRKRGGGRTRGEVNVETAPDDDLDAMILAAAPKVSRASHIDAQLPTEQAPYALTDFTDPRQEAAARAAAGPPVIESEPVGLLDRLGRAISPEPLRGPARADADAASDRRRQEILARGGDPDDAMAHDPIAQMITTGILGAGAGALAAPLGAVASGAANGAVQATTGGADPRDILIATLTGGALGKLQPGSDRPGSARPPRSQAEMDAVALQEAGPRRRDLPAGEHGTVRLAEEANQVLDARVAEREVARDAALHEAELDARRRLAGTTSDTRPLIHEIDNIRNQTMGARGPTIPEADRRLVAARDQLSRAPLPPGAPPLPGPATELSFDELNNLRKGVNYRLEHAPPNDYGHAGDVQAAGVVAGGVRRMDPRLGPGNFGGALDRYGAEADAIADVEGLRGPPAGRVTKLAGAGTADASSGPAAVGQENQIRQLQQAEPAANDLIAQIRARGVKGRRGLQVPSYMGGSPTMGALRAVRQNLDNMNFLVNPPRINPSGQVVKKAVGPQDLAALPPEIQLLLMQRMYDPGEQAP